MATLSVHFSCTPLLNAATLLTRSQRASEAGHAKTQRAGLHDTLRAYAASEVITRIVQNNITRLSMECIGLKT